MWGVVERETESSNVDRHAFMSQCAGASTCKGVCLFGYLHHLRKIAAVNWPSEPLHSADYILYTRLSPAVFSASASDLTTTMEIA